MPTTQTRRHFLTTLSAVGAAGLVRAPPLQAAEGPPETTSVRFVKIPGDCLAPQYIAEELLRADGFTDVRYVDTPVDGVDEAIARRGVDFALYFPPNSISAVDHGVPITVLSGVHVGCIELLAKASAASASSRGRGSGSWASERPLTCSLL